MKFPRWLAYCILALSGLAVLTAVAAFWVAWPASTTEQFISLMVDEKFEEANQLMTPPSKCFPATSHPGVVLESPVILFSFRSRADCVSSFQTQSVQHQTSSEHQGMPVGLGPSG